LVIGLLAVRAASTVTNFQLLPAVSTSAVPIGPPPPAISGIPASGIPASGIPATATLPNPGH
jgi:hypothetical protein